MSYTSKATTEVEKAIEETFFQLVMKPEGERSDGLDVLQPYAKRLLTSRLHVLKLLPLDSKSDPKVHLDSLSMSTKAILEGLLYQSEFEKALYHNAYSNLKASNLPWEELLTSEICEDEEYLNEIFVRLVEEKHGVEVTSWKQLQELTSIFEIEGEWEGSDKVSPEKKKDALRALANVELEDTFLKAMRYRYRRLLESILASGGKYKDLLEVSPTEFFLPEEDKEKTVAWTIGLYFGMGASEYSMLSVRSVADQIDAPYAVVLSAMRGISS